MQPHSHELASYRIRASPEVMLPNHNRVPTEFHKAGLDLAVPLYIPLKLGNPEVRVRLRHWWATCRTHMPEASVHEDRQSLRWKDDVRFPG